MSIERAAGTVIFRKEKGKVFYLLLRYPFGSRTKKDYWDFPKGHIEKGENEIDAAKRETMEETGLKDIKFIKGFRQFIKYFFKAEDRTIFKTVAFYLVETKTKEVKISFEHSDFKWSTYENAINDLKFKNAKDILKKVNDLILKKGV